LPKYSPVDDNEVIADPRDQWMYFFRRAEGSTVEELHPRSRTELETLVTELQAQLRKRMT